MSAEAGLPPGIPDIVPHRITFEPTAEGGTILTVSETGDLTRHASQLSRQGLVQVLDKAIIP